MRLLLAILLFAPPAGGELPGGTTNSPVPATAAGALTPAPRQGFVERGREYLEQGLFEKALVEFKEALKADPNDVAANLGRAKALLSLGDGRSALRWAKMATVLAPENVAAWEVLGNVYLHDSNQDYPRAEEAFRKELEVDPNRLEGSLSLARALSFEKKVEEAVIVLRRAVEHHPENTSLMVKLAESYYVLRKLDKAEELVREVLAKDPSSSEARRVLDQVEGRQAYNFWVLALSAVLIPLIYFGIRWMKKGRIPKV